MVPDRQQIRHSGSIQSLNGGVRVLLLGGAGAVVHNVADPAAPGRKLLTLRELEDDYIQEVLASTANNKTQAAKILGIHPTSLLRRLKKEQPVG